ncbi:hypothetical protein KZP23_02190 [Echinicola marina]|uniref:hypothetical protein n=1 Tax=Echinicola marina TaxID=2859768 RepID=UPI001CF7007E|nr:hypothetical protein [Echinicola marina]UCS93866.1 hypothetical protein KZP23_02190 [Echinicola marina]
MLVINNFNTGNNSRPLIADQVFSTDEETYIPSLLSQSEKEDLPAFFTHFFNQKYALPEARAALGALSIKIIHGGLVTYWESVSHAFNFKQDFAKLIEAAFLISQENHPQLKVKTISKSNLVPKAVLKKSRKLSHILPYLPYSTDPKDSLDPLLNLKMLFIDPKPKKLLTVLNEWSLCTIGDLKPSYELKGDHYFYDMVFHLVLDACHLIYVRSEDK